MRTIKELNRKIKDYELGNLKPNQMQDLINHLIEYKEYAEQNKKIDEY